ncbi:MAG: hypothetical protein IKC35_03480 [Clostridia bacterium]|nr:hypothetical protein [Clostridia bacterium]
MKRFAKALSILLVLVFGVATFTACAPRPKFDFEKAKENLEAAELIVTLHEYEDDYEEVRRLSAYKIDVLGDDDMELTIYEYTKAQFANLNYKAAKMELDMTIEALKLEKEALKLRLKHDESLDEEDKAELEEDLLDVEKEIEKYKNYVIGKSGKYVWIASCKEIIKLTK